MKKEKSKQTKKVKKEKVKKKRISTLAKELGMSSKALIEILRELGYEFTSSLSGLSEEIEKKVKDYIEQKKKEEIESLKKKKEIWGVEEVEEKEKEEDILAPEEVEQRLKETLSRMRPGARIKKKVKKDRREEGVKVEEEEKKVIYIPGALSVREFAKMIGVDPVKVVEKCIVHGVFATINQVLDVDTLIILGEEFGYKIEVRAKEMVEDEEEVLEEKRAPVVTVLGHVDHGKTTLLDYIRKTKIAEREAGAITQHIGAYQIDFHGNKITFIDTPGHEAFTALRARGVQVTDIALLVVAANEGVKEQTKEAISHAKAAKVPIIVAINKIDLPTANPEKVKAELAEEGLVPEDWGGDVICVPISAKTGQGIDELLEAILLVAEEQDLRTTLKGAAKGVVIETRIDRGRGPLCTVIIQKGILKKRDVVLVGTTWGRVRNLYNEWDKVIEEVYPSQPCVIQGLNELPNPGDILIVVDSERVAKEEAEKRKELKREQIRRGELYTAITQIEEKIKKGELKELPIIVKADTQGSVDALSDSISKMVYEEVTPQVIYRAVGSVTENDVLLASASHGVILAFNVPVESKARKLAKNEKVLILEHKVIYHALEEIYNILAGMIEPEEVEEYLGEVEVKKIFKISKVGKVAGCLVLKGKAVKNAFVRINRNGEVVYEGRCSSLKHYQEDVEEISAGKECGIKIEGFDELKEGDLIVFYKKEKVRRGLKKVE